MNESSAMDTPLRPTPMDPLMASAVLEQRSFARSYPLAKLLRSSGIPAGFGEQRLPPHDDGPPFALRGVNGVAPPGFGGHPRDARGDRVELATRSESPAIVLAHAAVCPGERTDPHVFVAPLPAAVTALRRLPDLAALHGSQPDWRP